MRNRWGLLRGVLLLSAGLGAGVFWGRSMVINRAGTLPPEEFRVADASELLARPLPALKFERVPLADVLAELSAKSGVKIEQDDVRADGLFIDDDDRGPTVTLELSPGPLGFALRRVADYLQNSTAERRSADRQLRWRPTKDGLIVSMAWPENQAVVVRLYQVGDLLDRLQRLTPEQVEHVRGIGQMSADAPKPSDVVSAHDFLLSFISVNAPIDPVFGPSTFHRQDKDRAILVHEPIETQEVVRRRLNTLATVLDQAVR